jgi:transposase
MGRAALKIKNFSSEELKTLLRKDEKYRVGVRIYACYQVSLGKKPKELETLYNTSHKSITNWVNRLNEGGPEALVDKKKSGRQPRLTQEQTVRIKDVVLHQSPELHGFNTSTWTGPLVIELIWNLFSVRYKKAQIYNVLHKMGLSFQKGKGIYPEKVERTQAVESIKKTPNRTGGGECDFV